MFASLLLACRGRPLAVWVGATAAFTAHVVIAVSVGVALFKILPHHAVDGIIAAVFLAGAIYSFLIRTSKRRPPRSARVIFRGPPRSPQVTSFS